MGSEKLLIVAIAILIATIIFLIKNNLSEEYVCVKDFELGFTDEENNEDVILYLKRGQIFIKKEKVRGYYNLENDKGELVKLPVILVDSYFKKMV